MKRHPRKRVVQFHGIYQEKYQVAPLEVYADSMFNLLSIVFKSAYPELLKEKGLRIAFENKEGELTELFDPEQELPDEQRTIHIYPDPEGSEILTVIAIVISVISIGLSFLLAPKINTDQDTTSGSNWSTPENVVGQGGAMPVILGERRTGSRVASFGIDSEIYRSRSS